MSAQGMTLASIYSRFNPSNDAEKDGLELNVGNKEDDLRLKGKSSAFRTPIARLSAVINTRYRIYEVLLSDVGERMGASTPADAVDAQVHRIWKTNPSQYDCPITLRRVKQLDELVRGLEVPQPHTVPTADSKQVLAAPAAQAVSQGVVQEVAPSLKPPPLLSQVHQAQRMGLSVAQLVESAASSLPSSAPASSVSPPSRSDRVEVTSSQPRAKTKRVMNPAYPKDSKFQPQSFELLKSLPPNPAQASGSAPAALSEQRTEPQNATLPTQAVIKELQGRFGVAGLPNSRALTSHHKRQE